MAWSRRYSIDGQVTVDSSTDTCLNVRVHGTNTNFEPSIFYLAIGSEATPADNTIIWYIGRTTTTGTGTAVTPQNLGPGTTASTSLASETFTIEPTYTSNAIMFRLGLNQRAAHSLVFDPEGCLTAPAVASNGFGLYPTHASATPVVSATIYFRE